MQLNPEGQLKIEELAQRYQVSTEAVIILLQALQKGNGTMAQFNHTELGGLGQWMLGGMTMVGDLFNSGLKSKINGLCEELRPLIASLKQLPPEAPWWPPQLGTPTATGTQNDLRYAYFAGTRRLAIDRQGQISVYDTQDHQISGISQQSGKVTFTSQQGVIELAKLPLLSEPPVEEDIFIKLEKLADLKQKGLLSQKEFAKKKAELLKKL